MTEDSIRTLVQTARVVAVVGMKDESAVHEPAHSVPEMMNRRGIRIVPINPRIESALGVPSLKSIAELSEKVDVIQVFRRSDALPGIADEILALPAALRPRAVWMQLGIANDEAAQKLGDAGIDVVMDRCFAVELARLQATNAPGTRT